MVRIGNFFFKYRNWVFILLYGALLIPSWPLFSPRQFGACYAVWPITIGLVITCFGQLTRGLTIGLTFIARAGKEGKPHAEGLITEGIFRHCRNPLYVGNILKLLGMGILANSLLYVVVFVPFFIFIYQSIVLAEEDFLRGKFGAVYQDYCKKVNRWIPRFRGMGTTFSGMKFSWKQWLITELTTQFIWLVGITLVLFLVYPELTGHDERLRNILLAAILGGLGLIYLFIRYLKKSGKLKV